jgi:hypothetical protein
MENTKTTLTNLDTGIEAIVELDGDGYKLTIRDNKTDTHIRHKDRNVLLQKAWQAVSVLVLLALSACGDNLCGCPFGTVCQPVPRQEGFVCVVPPQASDAR